MLPEALITILEKATIHLQHSVTEELLRFMHSVQLFGKQTAFYHFVIQTNSQSSNRYVYSNIKIMVLNLTHVFMCDALY